VTPPPSVRVVWVYALACLILAGRAAAGTETAAATSPAPATEVQITVVGRPADLRWARSLLGTNRPGTADVRWVQSERFDVRELFEGAAEARANVLSCWLDLTRPRRGRLYFAAPSGQRFLLRDVELSGQKTEVDRASLAEVLELSVAALLENERQGMTRADAESWLADRQATEIAESAASPPVAPLAPTVAAAPATIATAAALPSAASSVAGLSVLCAEQVLSPDFPLAERVGVEASLGRRVRSGWLGGVVAGEHQFPVSARNADIGLRLSSWLAYAALEAGQLRERPEAAARFWWRSWFARLGAGVDVARVAPGQGTQAAASAELAPAHWSAALVVRGALGTSWALGQRLALEVQLFADVFPTAVHYDVKIDGAVENAFSPWRVRPGLALGLAWR
jgi:hypothetical protein